MKSIKFPIDITNPTKVHSEHCFVIVGANGSGKSRLGAWIEKEHEANALRISAQRALSVPDDVVLKNEEQSWNKLFYGNEHDKRKIFKWNNWDAATTRLVDDYASVLSGIFARLNNEALAFHRLCRENEMKGKGHPQTEPTIIDKLTNIWQYVFPHREVVFQDAKISAIKEGKVYHGKEMSDGERVAIYLMGQCLIAPSGTILIIDEPEIHLHKSIMLKLWDKIEEHCPDKTFVYITHDLDFGASRKESRKIWVKSYEYQNYTYLWDIHLLDNNDEIPDQLLLEVLGNRKNVLFVEGDRGSYDTQLYSYIYDDWHVIPRHNCAKVIETTKAFNADNLKSLHNLKVNGLIDRDYMTNAEVDGYRASGIYTLEVAEVENLYLLEGIMRIVAQNQALEDVESVITKAKEYIFTAFNREYDKQLGAMCEREIQYKLRQYNGDPNDCTANGLKGRLASLVGSIDVDGMYARLSIPGAS